MEKVIMGTRLPAKLWLDEVEDSCMSQIMDLTSLPFAFKHIAIMPGCACGKRNAYWRKSYITQR